MKGTARPFLFFILGNEKKIVYLHFISNFTDMRKYLAITILVLFAVASQAQNKSGLETKIFQMQVAREKSLQAMENNEYLQKFNLRREGNRLCVGVVAKVGQRFVAEELRVQGIYVGSRVADIVSMRVPVDKLSVLESNPEILQYDVARPVYPLLDQSRFCTRVDSVQQGIDLPQGFTGKDVLIGVTDWGFDFTNPNFYDTLRRDYRIYKVWDQFKQSGPAPADFGYGTEFSTKQALLDAKCDTPGVYYYSTHGTHVSGIAAGCGAGTKYVGMAPEAQLMFVSFLLNEAGALDAFAWLKDQAREANKRLVVNMSWGMYAFGANDGTSLMSQAINSYADSGVVFVSSAGNNGDVNFHLMKVFDTLPDTLRTIVGFDGAGVGEGISAWGNIGGRFKMQFAFSSGDSIFVKTPAFETNQPVFYLDTIMVIGNDTIGYNVAMESSNVNNGRPYAFVNIRRSAYKVHMFVTAQQGDTVHFWNVYNKENHAGNTGVPFVSDSRDGYVGGDRKYGLSEPTIADKCITVAAHRSDHVAVRDTVTTYYPGNIASFSSIGPTMTNPSKPEISAPGVSVVSSTNSYTADQITSVQSVMFRSRFYHFAALSGTSMASPTVTGIVALILQANPGLTVDQVRQIIIETARTDNVTGNLNGNCSTRWGYGKIDAYAAVKKALETVALQEPDALSDKLMVYPNPAKGMVTVRSGLEGLQQVMVYSLDGRLLINKALSNDGYLDVSGLNTGIYVVRVKADNVVKTAKLVVK